MFRTPRMLMALAIALGMGACVAADDVSTRDQLMTCYDVGDGLGCVATPAGIERNPRDYDGDGIQNAFVCGDADSTSDSDGDSDSDSTSDSDDDDDNGGAAFTGDDDGGDDDGGDDDGEDSGDSGDGEDSDSDADSDSDEACGDDSEADGDGDGVPDGYDCDCAGEDPGDPVPPPTEDPDAPPVP